MVRRVLSIASSLVLGGFALGLAALPSGAFAAGHLAESTLTAGDAAATAQGSSAQGMSRQNTVAGNETAQSVAVQNPAPSYRSPTCNAFCDLFTAIKKGLPDTASAPAPVAAAAAAPAPAVRQHRPRLEPIRFYATKSVSGFYELQGHPVSLGLDGSSSRTIGRKLLSAAGVGVDEQPLDTDDAFDALSLGDIDAVAVSGAKAYAMMDAIPAKYGVHRIKIPPHRALEARNRANRQTAFLTQKTQ